MNNKSGDLRSEFYRACFSEALAFPDYLKTANETQRKRWDAFYELAQPGDSQLKLVSTFTRKMHILILSGIWCGDCMRQLPFIHKLYSANSLIDLKFIDNQKIPELRDSLKIQGGARVPVVLFLSEDFYEVARFGDRTLAAYRNKANRELGPACEAGVVLPTSEELLEDNSEWMDQIERAQLILRLSPMLRERYGD